MTWAGRPMGDYKTYGYAGDPGFLSSIWKGIKKVLPIAARFIPGVGPVLGTALGAMGGAAAVSRIVGPQPKPSPPAAMMPTSFPGVGLQPTPSFPTRGLGARGPSMPGFQYPSTGPGGGVVCPSGYHLAKDGSGRLVRNRRMNVANPRALRRSMRRVQGFEKLARRTISFTRRVKMKKRRSS